MWLSRARMPKSAPGLTGFTRQRPVAVLPVAGQAVGIRAGHGGLRFLRGERSVAFLLGAPQSLAPVSAPGRSTEYVSVTI
jgi:hypothetical protein